MKIVVLGDIGWRYLYHLGDEAMTEAAIDMLHARGIDSVTLIAGQPAVSEAFYGLPCVTRVGFRSRDSRQHNESKLANVAKVLAQNTFDEQSIYTAIRDCDAVIIAGGGNMNSRDYHLLFERVAAKRIAEHFEKPLYVSSQTVGPMLTPEDRALVVEIANYARAFGAREAVTAALMKEHVHDPNRVHHTLDDAALLSADDAARAAVSELTGTRPFVVASFTNHHGTMWASTDDYYADIAKLCRDIAGDNDVDVLLAPHAGSLDPAKTSRDQDSNQTIAALADSERVRATRMITAREDVALIEKARLSLSTRYHPTVFAPVAETPAIALASSYYSSVRMRGALGNVGLRAFVIPAVSLHLLEGAAAAALKPEPRLQTFLSKARASALEFQNQWWDALVESMTNDAPVVFERVLTARQYEPPGEWSRDNELLMPLFDLYAQTIDRSNELAAQVKQLEDQRDALRAPSNGSRVGVARRILRKLRRIGARLKAAPKKR